MEVQPITPELLRST